MQSSHGISIDQTHHIEKTILQSYFKDTDPNSIYCRKSPFPLENNIEKILFDALPLTDQALDDMHQKHNGSLPKWIGCLMHIVVWTRFDLHYAVTRLSGYMSCPKEPCFMILHRLMQFLYHHPHYPIFYPRNKSSNISYPFNLSASSKHGKAEYILSPDKTPTLKSFTDADQGRDLLDRKAITSAIWILEGCLIHWICKKQTIVGLSSNDTEMMSLLASVKRTNTLRRILLQLGSPQLRPTVICEDNQPLIAEVLQNRITANVRHLDIPLAYL